MSLNISAAISQSIPLEKHAIATWLLSLIREQFPARPISGVEVGVKKGELAFLLLRGDPLLRLLLVDRWAPAPPDSEYAISGDPAANADAAQHEAWLHETRERLTFAWKRIRIWHGESTLAADAERASTGDGEPIAKFDFVFLDADHSYVGRTLDLCDWYPLVKKGGLIAGGLLQSSFGGDCGRRALHDFLERSALCPKLMMGPASTWGFFKGTD